MFVEDEFAKVWIDIILREKLGADYDQVEVHAVQGDGNAVLTHRGHMNNPAVSFNSLCVIDGDSQQDDDRARGIVRLPGSQPERTVFEAVRARLDQDIAILTVSCQRAPEAQEVVRRAVEEIARTNRDAHLLFNQVGMKIGFVAEAIVRGAFLALWVWANDEFCETLAAMAREAIRP